MNTVAELAISSTTSTEPTPACDATAPNSERTNAIPGHGAGSIRRCLQDGPTATRLHAALGLERWPPVSVGWVVVSPCMDLGNQIDALTAFVTAAHWRTVDLLYAPTLATRVINCLLCGYSATRDGYGVHESECQFGGGRLERYQCRECDLVFGPLKMLDMSDQMLTADYQLLYETYRESNSTASETRAFRTTEPRQGGLYLNWGSGAWSETIDQLRSQGWDVWGYEPSVPPASPFVAGSTSEISATFDGLFSNDVIEHFRDPVAEFRRMASHLRTGALMTHASPCYELLYDHTRFHTAFYLGRSVEVLAARTGMKIVGRETDGEFMSVTFRIL